MAEGDLPLVIGVGTDERGDDGVGLDVARALRDRRPLGVTVLEAPGDLTRLIDLWEGRPLVLIIDAMRSGSPPGTIRRWEGAATTEFPLAPELSSHGLGLGHVLQLARSLDRLPPRIIVFGVEARTESLGAARTDLVADAAKHMVDLLLDELETLSRSTGEVAARA